MVILTLSVCQIKKKVFPNFLENFRHSKHKIMNS